MNADARQLRFRSVLLKARNRYRVDHVMSPFLLAISR